MSDRVDYTVMIYCMHIIRLNGVMHYQRLEAFGIKVGTNLELIGNVGLNCTLNINMLLMYVLNLNTVLWQNSGVV